MPRELDGKDASGAGYVPHTQESVVGSDAATGNGQAEPETGPIGSRLHERLEHPLGIPGRQAPTVILNIDQHAIGG